jgi:hypothetical protein
LPIETLQGFALVVSMMTGSKCDAPCNFEISSKETKGSDHRHAPWGYLG